MYTDEASQTEKLQISFAEMRNAGWDPDADLLWGYFFVDSDLQKLDSIRIHLEQIGFTVVDIFELADENDIPSGEHMLHVERVETHGLSSLAKRNVKFTDLALEFGIRSYDGWDVGKVASPGNAS
jgi:regulator of RNase E activity RraB